VREVYEENTRNQNYLPSQLVKQLQYGRRTPITFCCRSTPSIPFSAEKMGEVKANAVCYINQWKLKNE
jgi:hypothetical protein